MLAELESCTTAVRSVVLVLARLFPLPLNHLEAGKLGQKQGKVKPEISVFTSVS